MRSYPGFTTGFATILCLSRITTATLPSTWYVYSATSQDSQDEFNTVQSYYHFYKGAPACSDDYLAEFMSTVDVTELPTSSAWCDGCSSPLAETSDPIEVFEWYDKGGDAEWGHYSLFTQSSLAA